MTTETWAGAQALRLALVCAVLGVPVATRAQSAPAAHDFAEASLEDLLAQGTVVATREVGQGQRDAPGILTVLTREELQASGARDLLDVLLLVPGFDLGTDTYSMLLPAVRGLWAAEGKVLILFDGHESQELLYLFTSLGNRFPLEWVERIEIVRGPGSAIYGGAAELAVVNIVLRSAEQLQGVQLSAQYGQLSEATARGEVPPWDAYARRTASAYYGQTFAGLGDLAVRGGLSVGQGQRSDRRYVDVYGEGYDMTGQAATDPLLATLAVDWKGLEARALFERYHMTQRDSFVEVLDQALPVDMLTSSLSLRYRWQVLESLALTPQLRHVWQKPWLTTDEEARAYPETYFDPMVNRLQVGLGADWRPWRPLTVLAGTEYMLDHAIEEEGGFTAPEDPEVTTPDILFHNVAGYAQVLYASPLVNASLAARAEVNSRYGPSFVPRLTLSRRIGPAHIKGLVSQAFRVPSPANLAGTPDVTPERTTVLELELGYQFLPQLYVAANAFDITIDDPIVYFYDDATEAEGYRNYERTGSRGVELVLRYRQDRHSAMLTYTYYNAAGKNRIETYGVPGRDDVLLGLAPHKLTFLGVFWPTRRLSLGLTAVLRAGDRYGYARLDADEVEVLQAFGPELLVNLSAQVHDVFTPGLHLGLVAGNLTNTRAQYLQPYNNWHAPIPGPSTELLLRASYELSLL